MNDLEAAVAEYESATKAYMELDRARRAAIEAAEAVVRAKFAAEMTAASDRKQAAYRAKFAAENAAVTPHEWDGREVVMREPVINKWSSTPTGRFTETRGVVFTYRHGDDLGPGHKYKYPGRPFVRLLKKDGTPGARTVALDKGCGAKWELAASDVTA